MSAIMSVFDFSVEGGANTFLYILAAIFQITGIHYITTYEQ